MITSHVRTFILYRPRLAPRIDWTALGCAALLLATGLALGLLMVALGGVGGP